MKKLVTMVMAVFFLTFGLSAIAESFSFEDKIDTWTVLGFPADARPIVEGSPFSYVHDLSKEIPIGHLVTSAYLELDFTNDLLDGIFTKEYVTVVYDGANWNVGEVDNGQYSIAINNALLNDRQLGVTISVTNSALFLGTAWLDHSRVHGTAVPEPASLLFLGAGLLGLVGVRRKLRKG